MDMVTFQGLPWPCAGDAQIPPHSGKDDEEAHSYHLRGSSGSLSSSKAVCWALGQFASPLRGPLFPRDPRTEVPLQLQSMANLAKKAF
jgi:hypothetical protein